MFIAACLYNKNGIAVWCWEAAHALHRANHTVVLVARRQRSPCVARRLDVHIEVQNQRTAKRLSDLLDSMDYRYFEIDEIKDVTPIASLRPSATLNYLLPGERFIGRHLRSKSRKKA